MQKGALQLALGLVLAYALGAGAVPPVVSLNLPANGSTYAVPAAFAVMAAASDSDGSIAKVEFYAGTALVATVTTPPYAVALSTSTPGTYTLTAKAYDNTGDTATSNVVSITVFAADTTNPPPTVSLSWPAPNAAYVAPANVPILVTAADNGSVNRVEFYINGSLLAIDTAAPYGGGITLSVPGTYTITARAFDDRGASTLSAPVTVSVLAPATGNAAPTVALVTPTNNATYLIGDVFGINATAADSAGGSINRVEFSIGGSLVGYDTAAPYSAGVLTANAAGTYVITATAYDNQGAAQSANATIVVRASDPTNAAPSITLTAPANNAVYQAPGSVPVSATAADAGGSVNRVEFYANGAYLGVLTAAPYSGIVSNLPAGTYAFSARVFDNLGTSTASTTATVVVNAPPSVSLTAPANGTVVPPIGSVTLTATAADTDGTIAKVELYRGATLIATLTGPTYTYIDAGLAPGSYSYTAKAYDDKGGVATSAAVGVRVNALPTVAISAPATGTVVAPPGSVAITATAADADGAILKVELYRGSTLIATLTSGPYTYTDSGLAPGSYSYTAKAYDNDGGVTASGAVALKVNALPTVAIAAPASGTVLPPPGSVALTASAADTDGTIAKVELYRGTTLIATFTAAPYSYTDSAVPAGTYSYTAKAYDNNGGVVNSPAVSVRINALPSVAITTPASGTILQPPGSVALAASASDSDGTIAKVELYRGATLIATLTAAPYAFTDNGLASGSYSYTAKAYDNDGAVTTSAPVAVAVNVLPSVAITSPAGGTVLPPPGSVALVATAADTDGTISKVELYRGTTFIAALTAAPYSYTDAGVAPGSYTYTALAYDNSGGVATSATVGVRINALPSVAITAPAGGTVLQPPGSVALTAAASDTDGTLAKVELYRGATLIATLTAAPYTFTDSALAIGSYNYSAKAYDNNGGISSSAVVPVTVNALPTVAITAPTSGTVLPAPGSVSLTASAGDSDGSIAKVELYRGATLIATLTASPYSYTDGGLAAGSYSYSAKAYDNSGGVTASAAISVRVNALPSTAITAPADGTVLAPPGSVSLTASAADSDGTISKLELYRGATLIATKTAAPYTFTDTALASGSYSYTAKAYDNDGATSTSAAVGVRVNALPTVAITAPAGGTIVALPGSVALAAAAADSDGNIAKVELYRGATLIATLTAAPYSFSDTALASGSYSYTAKAYDNNGAVTTSTVVSVRVNAPPAVAITAPANGAVLPSPGSASLTATASDTDGGIAKLELYRGATLIATLTAAPYTFTDGGLAPGTYSYTAKAYDTDGAVSTSTAVGVRVNAPSVVAITAPVDGTVVAPPGSVSLTASVTDSDGTISKVEFYRGTTLIATVTAAPYVFTNSGLASGSYVFTAKAYDNNGAVTASNAVNVRVNGPPSVAITAPATGTVVAPPGSVGLAATAADTDGGIAKLELYRGTTLVATLTQAPYAFTDSGLAAGTYSYTAKAYDGDGAVTTSTAVSVRVNALPVTAITAPAGGTVVAPPGSVSLTASASDTDGTIAKVEFYRDTTLIATDTAAPYTFADAGVASGTYSYTVKAYDNNGGISTSTAVSVRVNALPAVSITAPAGGTVVAPPGSVALGASASDTDGTIAKVEFYRASTLVATLSAAPYTFSDSALASGSYSYTAKAYDNNGGVTTSSAVAVRVNALPTVAITAPANGAVLAPPGSASLTVTAADTDGAISKIELYRGATLVTTLTAAPYAFTDTALAAGTYSYTAKAYDGDGAVITSAAISVRVNALPSVALTAPADGAVLAPPGSAALAATAADTDGTISKVEFYRGATLIATVTAAPYAFTNTGLASGSYTFSAKAYDNNAGVTTSNVVNVRVNALPAVAITAPAAGTVVAPPGSVPLTASASDSDGTVAKVEFYRGTTLVATVGTAPYSFTDSGIAPGTYSYTAKAYDTDGAVTTSTAVSVRVNALPGVAITAPADGAVVAPPGTVALTASVTDSDGTIAKLEFYRGGTLIATKTAAPYTFSDTALASGTYSYTAMAYDNNGGTTTSAAVSVRVNSLPAVAITAPATGSVVPPPGSVPLAASASDTDGTVSKVEFYRGTTLIATATATPYSYTDAALAAGTYSYTAKAYDNNSGVTTSAAVSVRVNALPTVAITAPATGTVLAPPGSASLTVTAADADGTLAKVELYRGATLIATLTAAPYTFADSGLAPGTYAYTAKAYDSNSATTTSAVVSVRVNALPSVAITAPGDGTVVAPPASVALAASAADADGTIAKVEFYRGTTLIATVTAAPYTFTNTGLAVGSYSFTAKAYDNNGGTVTSAPIAVKVNAAPSVALTAPATGTVVQPPGSVGLTATASDTDGTVAKVEFYRGATLVGTATAVPYASTDTGVAPGTYSYTAKAYDDNGAVTTTAAVSVRVNALPNVAITAPASGTVLQPPGSVTFTATASDTDGTVAKVELYRDSTLLTTLTAAPYTVTDSALASSTYTYTARAYDNNGGINSSSVSVRVNTLPAVAISAPANGAVLPPPGAAALTVAASDSDGTISKVELYRGTTLIATLTQYPYVYSDSGLAAGSYSYSAKAYDSNNAVTTSATLSLRINALPTVAITAPATGTVLLSPGSVNVSAAAADSDGTIAKVELYRGTTLVATLSAAPYTFTDVAVPAGAYSYIAKAYDNDGGVTSSAPIALTVNALPVVALLSPANGTVLPPPGSVNLAATASDSDGTVAKVELYRGTTLIATLTAAPYTFTDSGVSSGTYTYDAKAYDNRGAIGTTATATVRVNSLPTVAITAPFDGAGAAPPSTVNVTAAASDSDGTIAKVDFYRGVTLIGTRTAPPYTVTDSALPAGIYSYSANAYDNDGGVSISSTVRFTVSNNTAPTVAISSPASGTVVQAPSPFTVMAAAADTDGSIARVEFYRGATLIATSTSAPYSVDQSGIAPGTYSYSAKAYDDRGAATVSSLVSVVVNAAPSVTMTAPANNSVLPAPAALTLTATATDSDGSVARVEFYNGATLLGQATAAPFQWSLTGVAAGPYVFYAKAIDNAGGATLSAPTYVTVSGGAPTTVIYQYDELGRLIGVQPQ
jgi:Bacterial Ig domain